MNTIAFVPAIADRDAETVIESPRVLRPFCGRPLLWWCLDTLTRSTVVDRVILCTNDDHTERTVAAFGLPGLEVRRGESDDPDVALGESLSADDLVLRVPTATPFLTGGCLVRAVTEFRAAGADAMVSVCRTPRSVFEANGSFASRGALLANGAFTLGRAKRGVTAASKCLLFTMDDHSGLDLATTWGFLAAEAVHRRLLPARYPALGEIRMLLTDVDGVLTDAGMYYGEGGDELKKFSTRDGMAFPLLRQAGLKIGIITGEDTAIVARRAAKLKADHLHQGISEKLPVVREICAKEGIELGQVAYVGDDIGDLTALSAVGFAACPSTAEPAVKRVVHYICERGGGEGCVREVAELILAGLVRPAN